MGSSSPLVSLCHILVTKTRASLHPDTHNSWHRSIGVFHSGSILPFHTRLKHLLFCKATWTLQKPSVADEVNYPFLSSTSLLLCSSSCCCSVAKSCLILCDPMNCSTPGFPLLHCLPEFAQTHVHWVGDAIQPSNLLSPPSPPAFNLSQHLGLFQWVGSLHQVSKVSELQFQSVQWIFSVYFL